MLLATVRLHDGKLSAQRRLTFVVKGRDMLEHVRMLSCVRRFSVGLRA